VVRVLERVLPLAFGAAVNTRLLAAEAVLLTRTARPMRQAVTFGAGAAAPLVLVGLIDLVTVHLTVRLVSDARALSVSAMVDVTVGALLLLVAVWLSRTPRREEQGADDRSTDPLSGAGRASLRGVAVTLTDFSTMAMFVTAAKDIAVGRLGLPVELLLFLLALAITLVTAWFPPLMFATRPAATVRFLSPIAGVLRRHGRRIGATLTAVIGVYLLVRGGLGL
jgi:hypothetical protein